MKGILGFKNRSNIMVLRGIIQFAIKNTSKSEFHQPSIVRVVAFRGNTNEEQTGAEPNSARRRGSSESRSTMAGRNQGTFPGAGGREGGGGQGPGESEIVYQMITFVFIVLISVLVFVFIFDILPYVHHSRLKQTCVESKLVANKR